MLRQLYMTLKFYQVNRPFSLSNITQLLYFHSLINVVAINLRCSKFIVFPYINPKSPYRTPPHSVPQLPRHLKQQAIYNELANLDTQQVQKFLLSYQKFKHRIYGKQNPTDFTNPFYQWVIKHDLNAHSIRKIIIDNDVSNNSFETLPFWSQERMGQSRTLLPDGRIILIAGEYEDYYDADFCIYNEVSVINTDGMIKVYSYPKTVFPATDFHTATLVGTADKQHIIIIGSLGYTDNRLYNHTPVYRLNIHDFTIQQVATRNSMGWINHHHARLQDNRIIITDGQLLIDDIAPLLDNIDMWVLNLTTLIWKNVTQRHRNWQRFYVRRQDGNSLNLWEYKQLDQYLKSDNTAESSQGIAYINDQIEYYSAVIEQCTNQSANSYLYHQLLIPPLDHRTCAHEEFSASSSSSNASDNANGYDHVLFIDEIKVGYKTADDSCIQVFIEGKLSEDKLELLQQNLRHKLSKLENMACEVIDI